MTCDCSCYDYDEPRVYKATMRRSRKPRRCCECCEPIEPGDTYERVDAYHHDGGWYHYDTCKTCVAIRRDLCPNGWLHEGLAETVSECLGVEL